MQTRLSFPGPQIRANEAEDLFKQVARIKNPGIVVIGGSLPPGVSPAYLQRMIRSLRSRQVPTLVDVPGEILKRVISAEPLFIKPNLLEFQELVGKKVVSISSVLKEARRLSHKVPLICVSSVEGGALLITRDSAWFGRAPRVKIKTTVGAGDSMVGAIAANLWNYSKRKAAWRAFEPLPDDVVGDLLRWGLASAAATLETHGTELGAGRQIRALYRKVRVEKVSVAER
jgi:fructose-1-phosphate kinase PfkB-like protein